MLLLSLDYDVVLLCLLLCWLIFSFIFPFLLAPAARSRLNWAKYRRKITHKMDKIKKSKKNKSHHTQQWNNKRFICLPVAFIIMMNDQYRHTGRSSSSVTKLESILQRRGDFPARQRKKIIRLATTFVDCLLEEYFGDNKHQ